MPTWTSTPPEAPGWYWCFNRKSNHVFLVEVYMGVDRKLRFFLQSNPGGKGAVLTPKIVDRWHGPVDAPPKPPTE